MHCNLNDHMLYPAISKDEECVVNNTKGIKIVNNSKSDILSNEGGYCSVMNIFTSKHV